MYVNTLSYNTGYETGVDLTSMFSSRKLKYVLSFNSYLRGPGLDEEVFYSPNNLGYHGI